MSGRRTARWWKALLYAAALVTGGALAQWTAPVSGPRLARQEPAAAEPEPDVVEEPTAPPSAPQPIAAQPIAASLPASEALPPLDDVEAPNAAGELETGGELAASAAERAVGAAYRDGMIITGSTPHRLILFTFDDGPDPATTPLLLDRLDDIGIKAVFFLVASRIAGGTPMERHQAAIAREIARRGHLIGSHTVDHVQLPLLDDAAALEQLTRADEIFARVFGSRSWLFRPPFGAHSQRIDQHLAARRYTTVLWNLGAGDFQVRTAEDVYRTWVKVFERREREFGDRGGIVLLHDTYPWSVDAFHRIVSHLMARNCELLDSGEELYDIVDDLDFFYVPRGDASPEAEAPRIQLADELIAERQQRLREATARRCKSLAAAF